MKKRKNSRRSVMSKSKRKVVVIGWDAADWKIIFPLIEAGYMPTLAKFLKEGVWGKLATLDPPMSPMLWTSIATGKRADKHGILGFLEPTPDGQAIRPVNSTSRKVKAIWNILHQQGYQSNVVGWWPSHPAEPINGVMVSNFYQQFKGKYGDPWPLPKGTVYPQRLEEEMENLRVHAGEMTEAHVLPFVPTAVEVDYEKDKRLYSVSKILAHCTSIHAAATHLMEHEPWDFTAIYYDAIDHFCHGFMKFHPPQLPGVPDDLFQRYKQVVTSGYIYHDMMLERLLELAGDDATVMIISDHGFHSDHLRPRKLPKEPAAPAHEHSPFGIFAMKGPGIKKNEQIFGASLLDITPTLLTLYDLPLGDDMEGRPLLQCFEEAKVPATIPSWEEVEGDCGMHSEDVQEDTWAAQEAMQQLIELGYVEAPDDDKQEAIRKTVNESQYYLAKTHIHAGRHDDAIPILETLFATDPDQTRYGLTLCSSYLAKKMGKKGKQIIDQLRNNEDVSEDYLDYMEGNLLLSSNRPRMALELLRKAQKNAPEFAEVHVQVGKALNMRQLWEEAAEAFKTSLSLDNDSPIAHHGLAITYLRRGRYEEAVNELLHALELMHFFPPAHYHLGEALVLMEHYEEAAQAFQMAASMAPGMTRAYRWLVNIYEEKIPDAAKAAHYRTIINERIKGVITIVSGLPRSGTSMMMQMLHRGGMEALTDELRQPDNNNPKGYYEYEPVKRLGKDNSWLHEAEDKVVKIIGPLLYNLPAEYEYKIVFMERDMSELLRSQQIMLGKTSHAEANAYPATLAAAFEKQLQQAKDWIKRQSNVEALFVPYAEVIAHPEEQAENINAFLGNALNVKEMALSVDPDLYRNKAVKS